MSKNEPAVPAAFEDVGDTMDWFDSYKRTPRQEFWWWIKHGIKGKISNVYYAAWDWFYRAFRGYADQDWYEYSCNTSRRAVKLLSIIRDKGHGTKFPGELSCVQALGADRSDWIAVLNDIIFFHTVCGCLPRPLDKQFTKTYNTKKGPKNYKVIDYQVFDLTAEEKERFEKGRNLYFENYLSLWD